MDEERLVRAVSRVVAWVVMRLKEPSTHAALAGLLVAHGVGGEAADQYVTWAGYACGGLALVLKERGG